jgi:hypothetical protein
MEATMRPNGRDDGRGPRAALLTASEARGPESDETREHTEVVFDFEGLRRPDLCDLSLILTARLKAPPGDRVWVRALPYATWNLLEALRVDHLFHVYPGPNEEVD